MASSMEKAAGLQLRLTGRTYKGKGDYWIAEFNELPLAEWADTPGEAQRRLFRMLESYLSANRGLGQLEKTFEIHGLKVSPLKETEVPSKGVSRDFEVCVPA